MDEIISVKEINNLKSIKGEVKGTGMVEDIKFILKEEGEEGLKRLEEEMQRIGYPFNYKEIKLMDFYPLWLNAILLTVIEKLFNYDEKKFEEIGRFEAKISFIIRLFVKYFFSVKKMIERAPKIWKKFYTVGELKIIDYSEDEKRLVLRLENFRFIPSACHLFKGYFSSIGQMVIGKKVSCKEIKCLYKGDDCHEFQLRW